MALDKIKTLVGKLIRREEGRRLLIGDTVYGYSTFGTVIHPKEFEAMTGRHVNNTKSLLNGNEVYVEFSTGSMERHPAKYLERIDPYQAIERLREMREDGNSSFTDRYLLETILFLEMVAERAFDSGAYRGSKF